MSKPMTVSEVIEALAAFDGDAEVGTYCCQRGEPHPITIIYGKSPVLMSQDETRDLDRESGQFVRRSREW